MTSRALGIAALSSAAFCTAAFGQSRSMAEGHHRIEIMLERLDGGTWHTIDPGLVLDQGERIRFKYRTNFDGYLYVMNQSTSGKYEQLFPRDETGQDNSLRADKDYQVPSTATVFRIAGPPGHEVVYWLVTPAQLTGGPPRYPQPPSETTRSAKKAAAPTLIPRCDDAILHVRGDCIDSSAGPKLVPRDTEIPQNLAGMAGPEGQGDLLFLRQKNTAVISSPAPLTGPVIYEFLLAHR
jgi:hypothetical protein